MRSQLPQYPTPLQCTLNRRRPSPTSATALHHLLHGCCEADVRTPQSHPARRHARSHPTRLLRAVKHGRGPVLPTLLGGSSDCKRVGYAADAGLREKNNNKNKASQLPSNGDAAQPDPRCVEGRVPPARYQAAQTALTPGSRHQTLSIFLSASTYLLACMHTSCLATCMSP